MGGRTGDRRRRTEDRTEEPPPGMGAILQIGQPCPKRTRCQGWRASAARAGEAATATHASPPRKTHERLHRFGQRGADALDPLVQRIEAAKRPVRLPFRDDPRGERRADARQRVELRRRGTIDVDWERRRQGFARRTAGLANGPPPSWLAACGLWSSPPTTRRTASPPSRVDDPTLGRQRRHGRRRRPHATPHRAPNPHEATDKYDGCKKNERGSFCLRWHAEGCRGAPFRLSPVRRRRHHLGAADRTAYFSCCLISARARRPTISSDSALTLSTVSCVVWCGS